MISTNIPYADLAITLTAQKLQVDPDTAEGRTAIRYFVTEHLHEYIIPTLLKTGRDFSKAVHEEYADYGDGADPEHLSCISGLLSQMAETTQGLAGLLQSYLLTIEGLDILTARDN